MTRVKRGVVKMKRRRNLLRKMKGGRFAIGSKERATRQALLAAARHSFQHRKKKKGDFRRLWNIQIGAAVRPLGLSYSRFVHALAEHGVALNRKVLAQMAQDNPERFAQLVKTITSETTQQKA
ncbi:MAG: 50S ribosomal protein L20 [Candidatus Parcubacteria bacterium]|nr:MAG: 50S ribosomal protein L20 [Candidatus Parcubacteria bacterium]